jgi:prevent-host-death family protein
MSDWPVQEAKARFSELIDESLSNGPQVVTRHGRATAVVVPYAQWQAMEARGKRDLKAVLLDANTPRFKLPIPKRGRMKSRKAAVDVFT